VGGEWMWWMGGRWRHMHVVVLQASHVVVCLLPARCACYLHGVASLVQAETLCRCQPKSMRWCVWLSVCYAPARVQVHLPTHTHPHTRAQTHTHTCYGKK